MEKAFIVLKDSEYYKDITKYIELCESQRLFVSDFFERNNIKANEYLVKGNGLCGCAFNENSKSDIILSIIPSDEDLQTHGKSLSKPNEYELCKFKKTSKIAKLFAQECVDKQIVINIWKPRVADYITKDRCVGCPNERFVFNDIMYLKVESKNDDFIDDLEGNGFKEIKMSEFYRIKEEFENQ